MADRAPSLLTATLATFDVAAFVLVAVLAGHASGALSDLLAGLDTLAGVVVFAYLWFLVWVAVRWALGRVSIDESGVGSLALHAFGAGAAVGFAFLLGLVLVAVTPSVVAGTIEPLSFTLIAAIGGGIAVVVGGLVGLVFGLVDLLAYRAAGRVLPPAERGSDAATESAVATESDRR